MAKKIKFVVLYGKGAILFSPYPYARVIEAYKKDIQDEARFHAGSVELDFNRGLSFDWVEVENDDPVKSVAGYTLSETAKKMIQDDSFAEETEFDVMVGYAEGFKKSLESVKGSPYMGSKQREESIKRLNGIISGLPETVRKKVGV